VLRLGKLYCLAEFDSLGGIGYLVDTVEFALELRPGNDCLVLEVGAPEVSRVLFGHTELLALVDVLGKEGLEFGKQVRED